MTLKQKQANVRRALAAGRKKPEATEERIDRLERWTKDLETRTVEAERAEALARVEQQRLRGVLREWSDERLAIAAALASAGICERNLGVGVKQIACRLRSLENHPVIITEGRPVSAPPRRVLELLAGQPPDTICIGCGREF